MPTIEPSIEFIPMCWGWEPGSVVALAPLRAQHPPVLFGFNEPDHTDQSNLAVDTALDAWPALEGIAEELVGPSCAQPAQSWMRQFMDGAERRHLRVDSVGFHHYGPPSPENFIELLERVRSLYARPIWVTEFAAADWKISSHHPNPYTTRQVVHFMESVCRYMENTSWVRGYAWYPWGKAIPSDPLSASAFFLPDGRLTEVGQAYTAIHSGVA